MSWTRSIRWRLLLALLATLFAAALLMGGLTYRAVLEETEALFDYQLQQMALSLRDQGQVAPAQAQALSDEQLDFVVQIWSVDGREIYATRRHEALPGRTALGLSDVDVAGQAWRSFAVIAHDRVIQVAQPQAIRRTLAARAALRIVAPLAWLALPLGALLWWLVSHFLKPLARLASDVRTRDAASLTPLDTAGLPDEASALVESLNALLQRLGEAMATQRDFLADAAHELRTPLQALKLQLQALQRADDPAAREQAMAALGDGIGRAQRLVEQLLALARSEAAPAPAEALPVELNALTQEVLGALWPLAQARHQSLSLEAERPHTVAGDRAALYALVRNLADNALRYTPDGGAVRVQLTQEDGQTVLTVDDSGPGIAPAERARVFDRFWRRSSGQADGSGLGLAIVQAVARRHHAALTLGEAPLGGLRVQVRFAGG